MLYCGTSAGKQRENFAQAEIALAAVAAVEG